MSDFRLNGQVSNKIRLNLGVTGLAYDTADLLISAIADNSDTPFVYTGANIENVTGTIGTYQTPSTSCCRFIEVDATNHPGLYEVHFLNAVFAVSSALYVDICVSGAAGLPATGIHYRNQLDTPVITENVTEIVDGVHNGTVLNGTVDASATSLSIPVKTLDITLVANDQVKGRVILFTKDTVTAELRGQGAPIDSSTTTHLIIANADELTTAPAEDDVFRIV